MVGVANGRVRAVGTAERVGRHTHAGRGVDSRAVVGDGRARRGEERAEVEKWGSIGLVGDPGAHAISVCTIGKRFQHPS